MVLRGVVRAALVASIILRSPGHTHTKWYRSSVSGNTLLTNLGKTTGNMTDWPTGWDMEDDMNDAWAVDERQPQGLQYTPR